MKPGRRQQGKGALELIEEATHLVRTAPAAALAAYYLGAIPFVLGLLFYWADMSRSPFARQHLADASLAMGVLFLWMKFWQVIFARRLRFQLSGQAPPPWGWRGVARVFLAQTILQPSGLFLIPLSLIPALPFAWVHAFYQNVTALAGGEEGTGSLFRRSLRQASLWPMQNNLALLILFGFACCVLFNWMTLCLGLPQILKMLFGFESVFTRSPFSLLNTTFFAAMFGLTYLAVDPLLKSFYVLRCFYGEALQSGEDLKADLRPFFVAAQKAAATVFVIGALLATFRVAAGASVGGPLLSTGSLVSMPFANSLVPVLFFVPKGHHEGSPAFQRWERDEKAVSPEGTVETPYSSCCALRSDQPSLRDLGLSVSIPSLEEAGLFSVVPAGQNATNLRKAIYGWGLEQFTLFATAVAKEPSGGGQGAPQLSAPELDRAINETIHERKYTWRMPRAKTEEVEESNGLLSRFFSRVSDLLRKWARAATHWLREWWRKLMPEHRSAVHDSGYTWIMVEQVLLWVLIAAVVIALALLLYRVWRQRAKGPKAMAGEPIFPLPDVADENVGADQLPEDGWVRLGRELLQKGEYRIAMRAFYLASLAHLAARNLVRLARFKSNREYERELRRRAHALPELLALFGDNISVFERIWYGTHEASLELVNQFASKVERLKANV
jgi:hypothetical protein